MIAATDPAVVDAVESVLDVRSEIESMLDSGGHAPPSRDVPAGDVDSEAVRKQLEDLGYV